MRTIFLEVSPKVSLVIAFYGSDSRDYEDYHKYIEDDLFWRWKIQKLIGRNLTESPITTYVEQYRLLEKVKSLRPEAFPSSYLPLFLDLGAEWLDCHKPEKLDYPTMVFLGRALISYGTPYSVKFFIENYEITRNDKFLCSIYSKDIPEFPEGGSVPPLPNLRVYLSSYDLAGNMDMGIRFLASEHAWCPDDRDTVHYLVEQYSVNPSFDLIHDFALTSNDFEVFAELLDLLNNKKRTRLVVRLVNEFASNIYPNPNFIAFINRFSHLLTPKSVGATLWNPKSIKDLETSDHFLLLDLHAQFYVQSDPTTSEWLLKKILDEEYDGNFSKYYDENYAEILEHNYIGQTFVRSLKKYMTPEEWGRTLKEGNYTF